MITFVYPDPSLGQKKEVNRACGIMAKGQALESHAGQCSLCSCGAWGSIPCS